MATLNEIMAAKAAAREQAAKAQPQAPDDPELTEAINRIDPPDKPRGIVLSKEPIAPEPRGQATPILTDDAPRSMGQPNGEGIDLTPIDATPAQANWHAAVNAPLTELVIMSDPRDDEVAWIAIRNPDQPFDPILLYPLPFWEHPRTSAKKQHCPF